AIVDAFHVNLVFNIMNRLATAHATGSRPDHAPRMRPDGLAIPPAYRRKPHELRQRQGKGSALSSYLRHHHNYPHADIEASDCKISDGCQQPLGARAPILGVAGAFPMWSLPS